MFRKLIDWVRGEAPPDPNALTPAQIHAEIEALARDHMGMSADDAIRKLNAGELDGTAMEVEIRGRLFLLGDEPAA